LTIKDYPVVLTAKHIAEILGVSVRYAYDLMDRSDFPKLSNLGRCKRVFRDDFFAWLEKSKLA
jgi:predicted DNA-binding transcriptional regulator AlpA